MPWQWSILRAAVEQEIRFPNQRYFESYIHTLDRKGEPYEIVSRSCCDDGTIIAVMRKRYNNTTFFSRSTQHMS